MQLHQQERLAGILNLVLSSGVRLNPSCHVVFLAYDQATSAWHLTSMLDPRGQPVDLNRLGIPMGPLAFTPPSEPTLRPLGEVMHQSWSAEQCALVIHRCGVRSALGAVVPGDGAPSGMLLVLLDGPAGAVDLGGVLLHAATAAGRVLGREITAAAGGLLAPAAFAERATGEIERARRYGREASLLVIECERSAHLAQISPIVARLLRQWDIVGRLGDTGWAIGVLLPETSRAGVSGVLRRLEGEISDVFVGAAVFPEHGMGFAQLVASAWGRARLGQFDAPASGDPHMTGVPWLRGARTGAGLDAVRCSRCLTSYRRATRTDVTDEQLEAERLELLAVLQAECPRHAARMAHRPARVSDPPAWIRRVFGRRGGQRT